MALTPSDTYQAALRWHLDEGAAEPLLPSPRQEEDRGEGQGEGRGAGGEQAASPSFAQTGPSPDPLSTPGPGPGGEKALMGSSEIAAEARRLALAARTLDELRESIAAFDGIAIRKNATSLVFGDGNPAAQVMIVGEAPGPDEDRSGLPFSGPAGALLDRILAWIGLDRTASDPLRSVYLASFLNWRPPGNRSPDTVEIEASLPFIERHIALARPRCLILTGITAQILLNRGEGLSRLRGQWHDYRPRTAGIAGDAPEAVPALATYPPSRLLTAPLQKRAVWQDMLALQDRLLPGTGTF